MSSTAWMGDLSSLNGWGERLSQDGPKYLSYALLAALAVQLGVMLTRQAPASADAAALPGSSAAALAPNRTIDVAAIANAHLFGRAAAKAANSADAPQTSMPLVLSGVYAVDNPEAGLAVIGPAIANSKVVKVGDNISGGARLHSVYPDRVILDRGGTLEALYLPKTASATQVQVDTGNPTPSAGQRLRNIVQNGTLLNGLIRVQAVMAQGGTKLSGFRVYPGGRNSINVFNQLGLRSADLITHVNGTALDDPNRSQEILNLLSSASSASVTVVRNGQPMELNLNFDVVAQAAEEAVAADAAVANSPARGGAPGASASDGTGSSSGGPFAGGRPGRLGNGTGNGSRRDPRGQ